MAEEDLTFNPEWRARIKAVGKMNFVREEMLRLGFYSELDKKEVKRLSKKLEKLYPKLSKLKSELSQVSQELSSITDIEVLLKEARRSRIARVKEERAERQARKQKENEEKHERWTKFKNTTPPFLGVGVSGRLIFEGGDSALLEQQDLPQLETANDLAELMEISIGELKWLCYERSASSIDHYSRFEIPKKSGGVRLISSPKPKLRKAQTWILDFVLNKLQPSTYATAFRKGRSIVTNAQPHLGSEIVVRFDFKDFFPTITFPRVRGFFEYLGFNPGISTLFALIATDAPKVKTALNGEVNYVAMGERSLPQGACTSPALANLIARKLDYRLAGLCKSLPDRWNYTRYADDLTFSVANPEADVGRLHRAVHKIVNEEGFYLNDKKTSVMRAPGRRLVTGLLIDKDVRLTRRDLRRFRAFLHRCKCDGVEQVSNEICKDALAAARGYLSYIQMVMPDYAIRLRETYPWL